MPRDAAPSVIPPHTLIYLGGLLYGARWQHQLAEATEVSQSMISLMAKGDRTINVDFAERLRDLVAAHGKAMVSLAAQLDGVIRSSKKRRK